MKLNALAAYHPTLSQSWPAVLGLVAIIAVAIALRLPAFDRPPQLKFGSLYQDENKTYTQTLAVMKRKSLLAHRPYGIYRILEPQFQILRMVHTVKYKGRLFPILSLGDFARTTQYELENTFLLLRLNALAFGLGIIVMTFAIGRKIGGDYGGLLAAFLVTITPLMINYSRMMYYDIAMVFFFLIYIYLFARSFETKRLSYVYATVAVSAIAFTMKQNAVVLFLLNPLLLLSVVGDWRLSTMLKSRHTYFLIAMTIATVAFGYPTLFTWDGISGLFNFIRVEHIPSGETGAKTARAAHLWTEWLTVFWIAQAPLSVLFFLAAGIAFGAYFAINRNFGWPVLLTAILYYAVLGYSEHSRDRMLMPLIPLLSLGMAGWAAWISRWRWSRLGYVALACVTILVAAPLLSNAVRDNFLLTIPDTRTQARDWLLANAPDGAKIAIEAYGPHLPLPLPETLSKGIPADRKTLDAKSCSTLVRLEPQEYVHEGYNYLVEAKWNYEKVERKSGGSNLDARRVKERKSIHWGFGRDEVLRRYKNLAEAFPVAARFVPLPPPASLMGHYRNRTDFLDLLFSNWWDPNVVTLWNERNSFVLGSEIVIYKVVPNYKAEAAG